MKITLYLEEKLIEYTLPVQVSGSYNFDFEETADAKLINVEAREGRWVLYSTDDSKVVDNGTIVKEIPLQNDSYYYIVKNGEQYLISVSTIQERKLNTYVLTPQTKLLIGGNQNCNVLFNSPLIADLMVSIEVSGKEIILNCNQTNFVYVNSYHLMTCPYVIRPGDKINILDLKLIILPNMFMINNPSGMVSINEQNAQISLFQCTTEEYQNIEVKDKDLYKKEDFFSKSPRMRRVIKEEEIKLDAPPKPKDDSKMPLILTIGPMLSMGVTSSMTVINTITQINSGATTIGKSWIQLVSGGVMLLTALVWPLLTKMYNKHLDRDNERLLYKKYGEYLVGKQTDFENAKALQRSILEENLLSTYDCLKIMNTRANGFWDKRKDQDDFLEVRVGVGDIPLEVNVQYPEEGFTIEESDLREAADALVERYKYIEQVPVGYSLYENFLTAIMGSTMKRQGLVDNILLQLMTFYCYDELKIVVFTTKEKENHWSYLKYSNYCFDNNKTVRYFASSLEESKELCEMLTNELNYRIQISDSKPISPTPHYLIICENYSLVNKLNFFKTLTELDVNVGYSTLILGKSLNNLPSKCSNFINLTDGVSGILKNSYEAQEVINFVDEIDPNLNMHQVVRILSNIPVEIAGAANQLPDAVAFLEMEKVGKVEQLNILNRWNTNDSTLSLKAEVGVDEDSNLMYLDLHEKYHGPHGLIAGMTGSGKSEFIITYILSLAMNYSPDDVAFILIDYKGGGLAFAFENKLSGVVLPHLAGTITNLDKAEMSRTLVSIDSEVKRRQELFNIARDQLGESTIDIYKYQKNYHEGKLKDPIPHLFLIADEFAELKSQQPDFMDNLISVARIGRSLGVHLILATQKPSGVVNDQIWSNTKFRVCLKVQDESDSKEMLKKPDAASLKQTGRFFLQVGFDEYFALGQSGWCGAKYYPSDKIQKQVDKSISFISNTGNVIKSIQAGNSGPKKEAQGEQLAAVLNEIINVSKTVNKKARKLWLENIPETILVDEIEKKYNVTHTPFNVEATIGEYDAPELQKQGLVKYNYLENGNTIIYGVDGSEKEKLLTSLIYGTTKHHTAEEINLYIMDYGSESLRSIMTLPQVGGMVFTGEDEKYTNLIKLISEEQKKRKKLFIKYGGEYKNYIKNSQEKLPLKVVIINNYDSLYEARPEVLDEIPELLRDSTRYGIIFILTANSSRSIHSKINQNCPNIYCLHLKDSSDYGSMFTVRTKLIPRDMIARGLYEEGGVVHEFQTASLSETIEKQNEVLTSFVEEVSKNSKGKSVPIPSLPAHVSFEDISSEITNLSAVPYAICKDNLEIQKMNYTTTFGSIISANKIENTTNFVRSLVKVLTSIKGVGVIVLDAHNSLTEEKTMVSNYYNDKFEEVFDVLNNFIDKQMEGTPPKDPNIVIIFNGIHKILSKLEKATKLEDMIKKIKKYEKICAVLVEDNNKIKNYAYDDWFKSIFSQNDGIWIGKGMSDQSVFKYSNFSKDMTQDYKNDMGYVILEGTAYLTKVLDFYPTKEEDDE